MQLIAAVKNFLEQKAFGVCTSIGEKLGIRTSVIRLFFIYASLLAAGSTLIIYLVIAFWINLKSYLFARRTSIWD